MLRDSLITETIVECIPVNWPRFGDRRDGRAAEGERLARGLKALCDVDDDFPLMVAGRAHFPVRGPSGLEFSQRLDGGCEGAIVLSPDQRSTNWMRISFKLVRGRGSEAWLTAECNPTTLLAGNNVHPATFADDETGCFDRYPSSAPRAVAGLLRICFRVLDDLIGQVTNSSESVFDVATRRSIEGGDVHVVRAQYCVYLPCRDVPRFLQLMAVMFVQTIGDGGGIVSLADVLGLECKLYTHPETHQVTGILLIKKQGKNPLFSLVFYDKDVRLRQMRQRSSLPVEQAATVTENVRFDITLHSLGIKEVVRRARKWLKEIAAADRDFCAGWREAFASGEPESTALFLRRAIYILSHRRERGGEFVRRSFAEWLVPHMLREVLHLDVTVGFTADDLDGLLRLDHPVARAWAGGSVAGRDRWSRELASAANCGEPVIYRLRKQWRERFRIDIRRPYAYYRDLLHFGPRSLTTPRERQALLNAVLDGSGDEAVRLLGSALDRFEADRRDVVGATINARPVALPFHVAENVLTAWSRRREPTPVADGANTPPARRELQRLEPRRDRGGSRGS